MSDDVLRWARDLVRDLEEYRKLRIKIDNERRVDEDTVTTLGRILDDWSVLRQTLWELKIKSPDPFDYNFKAWPGLAGALRKHLGLEPRPASSAYSEEMTYERAERLSVLYAELAATLKDK